MPSVPSLASSLRQRVADAFSAALPDSAEVDPLLRRSDRADFQANGALPLAKQLGTNPRELGTRIVEGLERGELVAEAEVSGPGFLNLTVRDSALVANLAARAADERLGVPTAAHPGTSVIDYSQPNVAKQMHVGHLRNTVIGAALVNILEFRGEKVIRRHHIGDWGTQFGMLVQYLIEHPDALDAESPEESGGASMSRLDAIYKAARALFDSDEEFKARARARVVELQAGDPETVALWQRFVDESMRYFHSVYDALDVDIHDEDVVGESAYNDELQRVCTDLEHSGVAVRSDGALCVFFDDVKGPDGTPSPLIVQKSNGGFGYAATDLAAIRDRIGKLSADTLLYVVDSRQALHFKMVFETAERAGWLPRGAAHHLAFGSVLGKDGKPFKTREGDTVQLSNLLEEAVERARQVVAEKSPQLPAEELSERAAQVGIGAVKYADLSTSRTRDYVFDLDRMVSLNGDTGVYLQYAYARIQSILRKASEGATEHAPVAHPELMLAPAERALALALDELGETIEDAAATYEPHKLAAYLYQLATLYTTFYDQCPVLKAGEPELVENRLFLCGLTARTLHQGMALLGIRTPERL